MMASKMFQWTLLNGEYGLPLLLLILAVSSVRDLVAWDSLDIDSAVQDTVSAITEPFIQEILDPSCSCYESL